MKTKKSGQPLRHYAHTQFLSTPANAEAYTVSNPKSDTYFPGPLWMYLKNGFSNYRDADWYLVVRKVSNRKAERSWAPLPFSQSLLAKSEAGIAQRVMPAEGIYSARC